MNKDEYINQVLNHIKNQAFVNTIKQELEGHISDRIFYYEEIGYDTETAQQKAIAHMGSADKLGEEMNMLHDYKKHKIICIIGLIIFVLNLISTKYLYSFIFNEYISPLSACTSIIIAFIIYKYAFVSRCRIVLFLQSLASLGAAIYFTEGFNFSWIYNITKTDIPDAILPILVTLIGILFAIHAIICLTCSAEISALIKGKANYEILKRYKIYENILFALSIAFGIIACISMYLIIKPFFNL